SVVLPAPFGPMRATTCPASTANETRSRATTPPKRTLRSLTSRRGIARILSSSGAHVNQSLGGGGPGDSFFSGGSSKPQPPLPVPHSDGGPHSTCGSAAVEDGSGGDGGWKGAAGGAACIGSLQADGCSAGEGAAGAGGGPANPPP